MGFTTPAGAEFAADVAKPPTAPPACPRTLAVPRHLAGYARNHWVTQDREDYVRDKTFSGDLRQVRTRNQPNECCAAIRNLVTGAFRRAGFASTASRRH